jgi:hypothetical protein
MLTPRLLVASKIIFINIWYLFAIEIIDTQVARRGRQYHRNPPYKKKEKKNKIKVNEKE